MPCSIYSKQISDGQPSLSKRSKNGRMPRMTSNCDQEWISCCPIKRAPPYRQPSAANHDRINQLLNKQYCKSPGAETLLRVLVYRAILLVPVRPPCPVVVGCEIML